MANVKLQPLPQPLPPNVQRYKADGTPTAIQIDFEAKMARYLTALASSLVAVATAAGVP